MGAGQKKSRPKYFRQIFCHILPSKYYRPNISRNILVQICPKYSSTYFRLNIFEIFFEMFPSRYSSKYFRHILSKIFPKKKCKIDNVFKLYVDNGGMGPESRFWKNIFRKSEKSKVA